MLWLILFPALFFLWALVYNLYDGESGWTSFGWGIFAAFWGGVLATMVSLFCGLFTEHLVHDGNSHHQLVSLSTGSQIQGQFRGGLFVSYGYINSSLVYNYYVQNSDGTFSLKSRDASNTKIRQTTDGTHAIDCENYYYEIHRPWLTFLAGEHAFDHADCTLTIPAGSIKQTFNPNP